MGLWTTNLEASPVMAGATLSAPTRPFVRRPPVGVGVSGGQTEHTLRLLIE
jgi:hypothetical protein